MICDQALSQALQSVTDTRQSASRDEQIYRQKVDELEQVETCVFVCTSVA